MLMELFPISTSSILHQAFVSVAAPQARLLLVYRLVCISRAVSLHVVSMSRTCGFPPSLAKHLRLRRALPHVRTYARTVVR
jgi:hypothetical protein